MLSIFDLIKAETLDLDLAAWLMAGIGRGESFLVGARPGGAGKTTVMCALLNLIPPTRKIMPATHRTISQAVSADSLGEICAVCHEISPGSYFSYLWAEELREYCALFDRGCSLATNLHADNPQEARDQICSQNGVPQRHFYAFAIQVYLRVENGLLGSKRRIDKVYAADGESAQRLIFDSNGAAAAPTGDRKTEKCREFLLQCIEDGVCTIEETRKRALEYYENE